ncbi:MAG: hypothetical protein KDA79_03035 [Planctomycetaceae bacterium]|nr:hypothetical protein [Planctomycetaceae bacterium]
MSTTRTSEAVQGWRSVRGPAWRWERASSTAGASLRGLAVGRDEQLRSAHASLGLCRRGADGRREASRRYPAVAAAEALETDNALRERLMILVLGDCSPAEIAERLRIEEHIIGVWESLFFDVRDAREATGWVFSHVIHPEQSRGNGSLAARLKMAFAGGEGDPRCRCTPAADSW